MSTEPAELTPPGTARAVLWLRCQMASDAPPSFGDDFLRSALTRVRVAGAELLAQIGNTILCAVDAVDCGHAVDIFLQLSAEREAKSLPVELAAGIALGQVHTADARGSQTLTFRGAAIERAQDLANASGGTHLLVDSEARQRLAEKFLFARTPENGPAHSHPLDLEYPRKRDCRVAARNLHPASLAALRPAEFDALRRHCAADTTRHLVLRTAHHYDPMDWLNQLSKDLRPPLQLHLRQQAGALQPLGSLQGALAGLGLVASASMHVDAADRATLDAISAGQAVSRADAVNAVRALLEHPRGRCWVIADRLHHVDPATLGVLAECIPTAAGNPLMLLSVNMDAKVPRELAPDGSCEEVVIPAPDRTQREKLAATALGLGSEAALARRVAALSEPHTLAVLEGARTLVMSGDLVPDAGGFRWRTFPRAGAAGVPLDALLSEQLAGLPGRAYQTLETLCVAPPAAGQAAIEAVARRDGLGEQDLKEALAHLKHEGLVGKRNRLGARAKAIASAVRSTMPPARSAELHRFVAAAWLELREGPATTGFDMALVAHYLGEGGQSQPAATALLDAAECAAACGFARMGLRLAAGAVQLCDDAGVRARTRALVRGVDAAKSGATAVSTDTSVRPAASAPESETRRAAQAVKAARRAILSQEHDNAERLLDTAVAAGWGKAAALRLRAVAQMARNDLEQATQTLQQAYMPGREPSEEARDAVTWGMLQLQAGDVMSAVRSSLSALAICRAAADARGEAAALCMLSACYRAIGDTSHAVAMARLAERGTLRSVSSA